MLNREMGAVLVAAGMAVAGGVLVGAHGTWGWVVTWLVGTAVWSFHPPSRRTTAIAIALLVLSTGVSGALDPPRRFDTAVAAVISALLAATAVAIVAGAAAAVRLRAAYRRRGWDLAHAVEDRERARVEEALTAERSVMAGEIHDGLGHRLTRIAVLLGRLTLQADVPAATRAVLEDIRVEVADATEELGETVALLRSGRGMGPEPAARTLIQVADAARPGQEIDAVIPESFDEELGPHAGAALARTLAEGLVNAAKHAPGQRVSVAAGAEDDVAWLTVRNPRVEPAAPPTGSGHGLQALRLRLALLGGDLEYGGRGDFELRARVPVDAVPTARPAPAPMPVEAVERDLDLRRRRASRLAVLVPVALAVPAALVAVGYFAYSGVAAVLPPQTYAELGVGMKEHAAEAILPAIEMLDAPDDELPVPPRATCRYYESARSFFEREDVYRVCFTDGAVSHLETIPAP